MKKVQKKTRRDAANGIYTLSHRQHTPRIMTYHPAKVFRRTGDRTYCVQLARDTAETIASTCHAPVIMMPGVIDAHCISLDWRWNTAHHDRQWHQDMLHALEHRLHKLGTRAMFDWNQGGCVVQVIDVSEGVEIMLGPYHPERRAFVQCSMRWDLDKLKIGGSVCGVKRQQQQRDCSSQEEQQEQQQQGSRKKRRAGLK